MLLLTAGGALKANASRIAEGSCDVAVSLPRLLSARDIVANDGTLPQDTLITKSHIPDHIIFLKHHHDNENMPLFSDCCGSVLCPSHCGPMCIIDLQQCVPVPREGGTKEGANHLQK